MKSLFKIILILAACFATTFLIANLTGVLNIEQIERWLTQARELSPGYSVFLVIVLLFADLFIAVPTLTVTILAGYFLGFVPGAISALTGMLMAGIGGYVLSYYYGNPVITLLLKDETKRREAINTFKDHGFAMILLSRAMPILPEVTACLSGMTRMAFSKFLFAWLASSIPYITIAAYAGSISTIENPKPAIYTAIGLSCLLWFFWFVHQRFVKASAQPADKA